MNPSFLRVKDRDFILGDDTVVLRGYGLGSLLNLEHFMLGIPGTDTQIRSAIVSAYGRERADRFWDKYYRTMIDEADFEYLKQLGINAIRIPFNYRLFEDDQKPYVYADSGFTQIDRILDLCGRHEIFAILDLHAAAGGQNPDWHSDNAIGESLLWEHADFRRRTLALWKHIAARYASNRWIAAYDLLNEPGAGMTGLEWKPGEGPLSPTDWSPPAEWKGTPRDYDLLMSKVAAAVRKADPDTTIIIEGGILMTLLVLGR